MVRPSVHQALVSVDEAGREAAATAAIVGEGRAADPAETITLTVGPRFIFLARDRATGALLRIGRVSELEQPA